MIPGNIQLSVKNLRALNIFIILFLQMNILKKKSAFHHPRKASDFLFLGRWVQDKGLLKDPFSPEN